MAWGLVMKKNKSILTVAFVLMTVALLGATVYMSGVLSSTNSPTQIKKTKAAPVTYTRTVDFNFPTGVAQDLQELLPSIIPTNINPTIAGVPSKVLTSIPTVAPLPSIKVPTTVISSIPTSLPLTPTRMPTPTAIPTSIPTPTSQPLLAYKSTTISPTLIPIAETGGMIEDVKTSTPTPTKKIQPTGVQTLPQTGWIQISSILFIVAVSTIFFSLLF